MWQVGFISMVTTQNDFLTRRNQNEDDSVSGLVFLYIHIV